MVNNEEYNIVVETLNSNAMYIRYNDQLLPTNNGISIFTFNKIDVYDFYVVCTDNSSVMCEFNYPLMDKEGEYHLLISFFP